MFRHHALSTWQIGFTYTNTGMVNNRKNMKEKHDLLTKVFVTTYLVALWHIGFNQACVCVCV
jgi:hypothetical protein